MQVYKYIHNIVSINFHYLFSYRQTLNEKSRRPLRDPDNESNMRKPDKITNTNPQIDNNVFTDEINPNTKCQKISIKENHPKTTGKLKPKKFSDDKKLGVIELDHDISDSESDDEQSRNIKTENTMNKPNDLSSRNLKSSTNDAIIVDLENTSTNEEIMVDLKNNASNELTYESHESTRSDNNQAEIVVEMNKATVSSYKIEILDEKNFQSTKEKAVANSIQLSRNEMQNVINNATSNQNCKKSEDIVVQKPKSSLEIENTEKLQFNEPTGMEMDISDAELQINESTDDERNDTPENSASHFCDPKNESICLSKKFRIVESKGMN